MNTDNLTRFRCSRRRDVWYDACITATSLTMPIMTNNRICHALNTEYIHFNIKISSSNMETKIYHPLNPVNN